MFTFRTTCTSFNKIISNGLFFLFCSPNFSVFCIFPNFVYFYIYCTYQMTFFFFVDCSFEIFIHKWDWFIYRFFFFFIGACLLITEIHSDSKFSYAEITLSHLSTIEFKGERNQLLICGFTESRTNKKMKI